MVYIKSWLRFQKEVTELYDSSPEQTRSNIKFRACDGVLILKVTDNFKCLKHKTTSAVILNRFESLNRLLLARMSGTTSLDSAPTEISSTLKAGTSASPMDVDAAQPSSSTPKPEPGVDKKKKKGKSKRK